MKTWKMIPAVLLLGSAAFAGQEKRFVPERCFPLECMAYLRVPSGKSLLLALRDTLIGRIATDPEVHQALGSLPQIARSLLLQTTGPVMEITGRDPLEIAGLLQDEVAVSITGLDPRTGLSVLVAIEMGDRRREILEVVGKISEFFSRAAGRDPEEVELEGRKTVVWPIFGGLSALYHLRLGTHIVFASSRDVLRDVARAHDGGVEPGFTLASNPRYKECRKALALESPRLTAFANLEAIRGIYMMLLLGAGGDSEELMKVLSSSGLMSITTLGYSLGFRGGDVEGKMLLGTGDGARGFLGDLLGAFSPPEGTTAALPLIPAEANEAGALGVDGGKIFRAIHGFLRQGLPGDLPRQVDGVIQQMEKRSGLSLERDLFSLGRVDLHTFPVTPPAGGLIPDGLTLVRTDQFRPYREVIEKIAGALGRKPEILEGPIGSAGRRITYLSAGSVFTRLLGMKTPPPPEGLLHALLQPPVSLASTELDGGWTLLSNSPQAIWRHLARGEGSRPLSTVAGVDRRIREDLAGARGFVMFRGGTSFLPIYNSLIEIAASLAPLELAMEAYGIDLPRLPPGEKFLEYIKDGFLRVDAGPRGITIHGHRVLSSGSSGLWALPVLGLVSAVPYLILEEAAPAPAIKIPEAREPEDF